MRKVISERVATNVSLGVASWQSSFIRAGCIGPVIAVVIPSAIAAGNFTMGIYGRLEPSQDVWAGGASDVLCVQRTGITTTGRYYISTSPNVVTSSSATIGQSFPVFALNINNSAGTMTFDAYLCYEVEI